MLMILHRETLTMKRMTVRGSPGIPPLLAAATIVIVVFGLKYSSDVMAPIFLAATLAILFTPVLWWLEKKGLPSWLAYADVCACCRQTVACEGTTLDEYGLIAQPACDEADAHSACSKHFDASERRRRNTRYELVLCCL
jgi:hypothetical protein